MRKKIRSKPEKKTPKGERIDPKDGRPSAADLDTVASDPFYAKIFVGKPRC